MHALLQSEKKRRKEYVDLFTSILNEVKGDRVEPTELDILHARLLAVDVWRFMRIVEEMIRIDNPHDSAGLTASQFVSVMLVASGIIFVIVLRRLPLRSPRAVPFVPPEPESNKGKK